MERYNLVKDCFVTGIFILTSVLLWKDVFTGAPIFVFGKLGLVIYILIGFLAPFMSCLAISGITRIVKNTWTEKYG